MKKQIRRSAAYYEKRINFFYGFVPKSLEIFFVIYLMYICFNGYKQDQLDKIGRNDTIAFKTEYLKNNSLIREEIRKLGRRPSNQRNKVY